MVLGRTEQPPQRRPLDLACHHLKTIRQEKTRETSQAPERRPGQILEQHDLAENSTRQANLETACWGLRPTMGHYGCPMVKWWMTLMLLAAVLHLYRTPPHPHPPPVFSTRHAVPRPGETYFPWGCCYPCTVFLSPYSLAACQPCGGAAGLGLPWSTL